MVVVLSKKINNCGVLSKKINNGGNADQQCPTMKSPHLDRIGGLLIVVSTLTAKLARQGSILAGK